MTHTRSASADTLAILREEGGEQPGGVFHCFTEDLATARAALDLGFHISFSGIVTFKNARDLQEVAKVIPEDKLLVETDSPFLAPVPHRGRTNQPANVAVVGTRVADIKNIDPHEMARITTENACIAFPLLTS